MRILAIGAALLALVGCSSSSSSGGFIVLNGQWIGYLRTPTFNGHQAQMSVNFIANSVGSNQYSGTVRIISTLNCWTGGTITATVTGDSITLVISDANGTTINLTGSLSRNRMSGLFSSSGGSNVGNGDGGGDGTTTTNEEEAPVESSAIKASTVCGNLSGNWLLNRQ